MGLTNAQLKVQYNRAKRLGWIPFFQEAADTITKGYFDTADLLGIASRETDLDPKWLKKAGDGGNGFGLMQADKRSFPEFTTGDGWKDAKTGILFGAKVLMQKWHDYEHNIGKSTYVKPNTKKYPYVGKKADGEVAQHIVIAGYNNGRWPQYAYSKNQDIDKYTTGHDYGKDVLSRAEGFRGLLIADAPTQPIQPVNDNNSQNVPDNVTQNAENNTGDSQSIPPSGQSVTVTAQKQSAWSLFLSGITILGGWYQVAKSDYSEILDKVTGVIDWHFVANAAVGAALVGLGLWMYDRSKKRADDRTHALIATAADTSKNTVELK